MGLRLICTAKESCVCTTQISLPVFHEPELFALVRAIANDEHRVCLLCRGAVWFMKHTSSIELYV